MCPNFVAQNIKFFDSLRFPRAGLHACLLEAWSTDNHGFRDCFVVGSGVAFSKAGRQHKATFRSTARVCAQYSLPLDGIERCEVKEREARASLEVDTDSTTRTPGKI